MTDDSDTHKAARGALPWQEGDESAEVAIGRIRGGDIERIAALEAELAPERDALQRQIEGRAWDHFDPGFVDVPASEDYPGELASDGPYKLQFRDGRGGWIP
jgi:hypothetical protein